MARIAIALHEPFVRLGVQTALGAESDFELTGVTGRIDEVWDLVETSEPGALLLDWALHRQDEEVMHRVVREKPSCRVLVMVDHTDEQCTLRALLGGPKDKWPGRDLVEHAGECCLLALRDSARGCIPKSSDPQRLVTAIRAILAGEVWVGPGVAEFMLESLRGGPDRELGAKQLTQREVEVIGLVVDGLSNREIAERLRLGEQTVKNHVARIMSKMHVRNRVELALHAVRQKIA
jgi:DNA-binding NarL/FixJ family response regulator